VFGYSVFTVLTGSMRSETPERSLIITKYIFVGIEKAGENLKAR